MDTATDTPVVVDHNSAFDKHLDPLSLPFYNTLQWEPLETLVENYAPEKLRLNALDQPDVWAYFQYHQKTPNNAKMQSNIEIYDDSHYVYPLSAQDLQDLKLLAPYKWIGPGSDNSLSSIHFLKTYISACFIDKGHAMAEKAMLETGFYRTLGHAVDFIEKGQAAEWIFCVRGTSQSHEDLSSDQPPDSTPSTPLSSVSGTSEHDRESLERALCMRFRTFTFPVMSDLRWVSNPDVPTGVRLRVGSRDGQPVFTDFTLGAIASVEILIRQGETLRAAKTVRKGDLGEVEWNVPFSYIFDEMGGLGQGGVMRDFLKGLFVLEGHSSGSSVDIDEKMFCGAVDRIIERTGGRDTFNSTGSSDSTKPAEEKTKDPTEGPSDVVVSHGNDELSHSPELSFYSARECIDDESNKTREPEPVCTDSSSQSSRELSETTVKEDQALVYETTAKSNDTSALTESHDIPSTYAQVVEALQLKVKISEELQEEIQMHDERSIEIGAIIEGLEAERARKKEQRIANLALKLQKEAALSQCDDEIRALKRQRHELAVKSGYDLYWTMDEEAESQGGAKRQRRE